MPFETSQGSKTAYVSIEGLAVNECPVSRLTRNAGDTSRELVNIFNQTEPIKELNPMGKASAWPGFFLDATLLLIREKARHDHAQTIAAHKA
jgi:hypothetical protein